MNKPTFRIHRIPTGEVKLHPEHLGESNRNRVIWLMFSKQWTEPYPINSYLIEHPQGLILFDTGEDPRVNDPAFYPWWAPSYRKVGKFTVDPTDAVDEGIRRLGYSPSDVKYVVLSHLHSDHVGGIHKFPNATFLISEREWIDGHRFGATALHGYQKERFDFQHLSFRYHLIKFSPSMQFGTFEQGYDMFDDGSLVLVPTPGHTYGHMSMLISGNKPLCLAGDAIFTQRNLELIIPDGIAENKKSAKGSINLLRQWSKDNENAPVLSSHDPQAEQLLFFRNGGD